MLGIKAGDSHTGKALGAGGDHGGLGIAGQGFDPPGVAVDLVHAHLVFVTSDGGLRELAGLV